MNEYRPSLLVRYQLLPGGRLEASGSYRLYGAVFTISALVIIGIGLYIAFSPRDQNEWAFLLFGSVFLFPGFYLLGIRDELKLDGSVLRYTQLSWLSSTISEAPRSQLTAVRLSAVMEGESSSTDFCVNLVLGEDAAMTRELRLLEKRRETDARNAAEVIARHLDLPLEDAIGDVVVAPTPEPSGRSSPQPAYVDVTRQGRNEIVTVKGLMNVRARGLALFGTVMLFMTSTLFGGLAFLLVDAHWTVPVFIWGVLGAPSIYVGFLTVAGFRGRETISIGPTTIQRSKQLAGLSWHRNELPRRAIRQVRAQSKGADDYGVVVVGDDSRMVLGTGLDEQGLYWLADYLVEHVS